MTVYYNPFLRLPLSSKQKLVAMLFADGMERKDIGIVLSISEAYVKDILKLVRMKYYNARIDVTTRHLLREQLVIEIILPSHFEKG